jgi:hypothetical protein
LLGTGEIEVGIVAVPGLALKLETTFEADQAVVAPLEVVVPQGVPVVQAPE